MSTLTITWPDTVVVGKKEVPVTQVVTYTTTQSLVDGINALLPQQGITVCAGYGIAETATSAYVYISTYAAAAPKSGKPMTLTFSTTFGSFVTWITMSDGSSSDNLTITFNVGDGIITSRPVEVSLNSSDLD